MTEMVPMGDSVAEDRREGGGRWGRANQSLVDPAPAIAMERATAMASLFQALSASVAPGSRGRAAR